MQHTRLHAKVITPVQVFDQAQTIRVLVAPSTWEASSILERSNSLVPLQVVWRVVAFEVVATWEAKERLSVLLETPSKSQRYTLILTGFSPFSASIKSIRKPFGRSLYVGGKRLIRLKSSDPSVAWKSCQVRFRVRDLRKPTEASYVILKVLLTLSASASGVSTTACSLHSVLDAFDGTSTLAKVVLER